MARESRFGLFLAAVMVCSLAVAASADPKLRTARSAERSMERTHGPLAADAGAPRLRVVTRAEREARESRPAAPSGMLGGPLIGTHVGAAIDKPSEPSGAPCPHCNPR